MSIVEFSTEHARHARGEKTLRGFFGARERGTNARARVFKNYLDDATKNKGSTHIVRVPDGDFFLKFPSL